MKAQRIQFSAATAAVLASIALSGCGQTEPRVPLKVTLIQGFDVSNSMLTQLDRIRYWSAELVEDLKPETVELLRFDCEVREFFGRSQRVPGEDYSDALESALAQEFAHRPTQDGTSPVVLWREIERRANLASEPVVVTIWTDADVDNPESIPELKKLAAKIAENHSVVMVAFLAVDAGNRDRLREIFGCFGPRLQVFGSAELSQDTIDTIEASVKEALSVGSLGWRDSGRAGGGKGSC